MDDTKHLASDELDNNNKNNKKQKLEKDKPGQKKRALIWVFFIALFMLIFGVIGYLLIILNGERILNTNINKLSLNEATVLVDRQGNHFAKVFDQEGNREFVPYNQIPKQVSQAFVTTEDKRFFVHGGVDLIGIGRALVKDVVARGKVEGASTITQQLAKNLFLNADKTLFRKATEASIALALEQKMSKEEILELYLNRIYFGRGQYGLKTAALYYFDVKDLKDLKIWQIATLAAIPKAPGVYNPLSNAEKSLQRRKIVLQLMLDQGVISAEEMNTAAHVEYKPSKTSQQKKFNYATYVDFVVHEASERTGKSEEEIRTAGYQIQTSIDTKAQQTIEEYFANDANFESSIDKQKLQSAMVVMDQHDGSLIAMVGGRDYTTQGWNRITKKRQPGSAFKPVIAYGPALESGGFYPWSMVEDVKQCYGNYCPTNLGNVYMGRIPMREAIRNSRNSAAVWLLNEIGINKGLQFAEKLGIPLEKEESKNLSLALGGLTHGVTPLQMVRAYGAFANGGQLNDAHAVDLITDSRGKEIYKFKAKAKQVMDKRTAYYMTSLLRSVVEGGTGQQAKVQGREVVGKTGTVQAGIPGLKTKKNRDLWFSGYTPELTATLWLGYDKTDKNHLVAGGSSAVAKMFSTLMGKILPHYPHKSFQTPEGIQEEKLRPVQGLSATFVPNQGKITLNWKSAQDNEVIYKIYRKKDTETKFVKLTETIAPGLDDFAIETNQKYTYYVTAYLPTLDAESSPSQKVSVSTEQGNLTEPKIPGLEEPSMKPADKKPDPGKSDTGKDSSKEGGTDKPGKEPVDPKDPPVPPVSPSPSTPPSPSVPPSSNTSGTGRNTDRDTKHEKSKKEESHPKRIPKKETNLE